MIDVEAYVGWTRFLFPPGRRVVVFCLPTHRLDPLVRSSIFSPPTRILEMDAGGSIGYSVSRPQDWGRLVGEVRETYSRRWGYRKLYDYNTEPEHSIRQLRAEYHQRGIKRPVVRYIYCIRPSVPTSRFALVNQIRHGVFMLWRYTHHLTDRVVGLDRLEELARRDFEGHYTFDLYAVSIIRLEDEDLTVAIQQAHDENYLYDVVRPVLLTVHSEPSVYKRVDYPEAPRVISEVIPIASWTRPHRRSP